MTHHNRPVGAEALEVVRQLQVQLAELKEEMNNMKRLIEKMQEILK